MDTIIQKASKGNRVAMKRLYESNKKHIYYMAHALLRGSNGTIEAAKWAMISSLQALSSGGIQAEKEFTDYAIMQVAKYCKKDITKKDSNAFRMPLKKNFRITTVDETDIKIAKNSSEYYFNYLPANQRFVLVLRLIGGMDAELISKVIGMKTSIIQLIIDAEPDNLGKIYLTVKDKDGNCIPPMKELLSSALEEEISKISVPDALNKKMEAYIDSVAAPIEASAKNKQKKITLAVVTSVCIVVSSVVLFSGGDKEANMESIDTTNTMTSDTEDITENETLTDDTETEERK